VSVVGIGASGPGYDRAEYLPQTREQLARLAEIVDSRDVFALLQGPSFATFAARLNEFAGFEFAIATLNSFPPVEQQLRRIRQFRSDHSERSISDRDAKPLHFRLAAGKCHFQSKNIDAHKIRAGAIKRNERWHLDCQALLDIGSCHPRPFDSDLAIFGW